MIRMLLAGFVVVSAMAGQSRADEKYSPEGSNLAITFPAAPKSAKQDVDAPFGKIVMNYATYDVNKSLAMIVMYNDYPDAVAQGNPQDMLGRVKDGTKGTSGKELADKEITLGKVPGRDFLLDKEGQFYRARIYLDGNRLYQVIVSGAKKDEVTGATADKFLDSFEISK